MLNFIHFYYSTNDKLYSSYSIFLKLLSTEILRGEGVGRSCTSRSANHSRYLAVRLKFKLSVFIFF
ncbi:unnamed protein product [Oikopleura dioica]|uniref:Uncharacterized protein n=1 Tax=Oikopleura dioica TaxID=34765 RepID=E4XUI5_OIKDI|nr:unnamed protein product [Oikopleura dioica]